MLDTPVGTATWDLLRYRGPVAGHTSALWRDPDRHKPRHMSSGSIDGAGVGEDDGGGDGGGVMGIEAVGRGAGGAVGSVVGGSYVLQ